MVEWWKQMVERRNSMALNIKNEETCRLAKELARRNGETLTVAVTIALKERIERQKPNPKAGLAAWLNELSKQTAPLLKDLPPSDKIGDLLFDKETGLPL
jgi:antitoxin VapB